MKSQWFDLKDQATQMRRRGASIRDIEKRLGIPRSTLSGWLRPIQIHERYRKNLARRFELGLAKARKRAVVWHNNQRKARMELAAQEAAKTISQLNLLDDAVLELALAFLYLGEGAKKSISTSLGNSNPLIMQFFVKALQRLYNVPADVMRCELHLRADQDPLKATRYWSKVLGIPRAQFSKPMIDQRTAGKATYGNYRGVCVVNCSRVAIQRKLMYISTNFCGEITGNIARD